MSTFRLIALIVLMAVAGTVAQPGRAEAIDPLAAGAIVGAAVVVVAVIAIVVIANVRDRQRGEAEAPMPIGQPRPAMAQEIMPLVVAFDAGGVQAN